MKRDTKYYYVRHIPKDLTQHYSIQRLCFSLKTNSDSTAIRYSKSITQRLDEILAYWYPSHKSFLNLVNSSHRNENLRIREDLISYAVIHRCDGRNVPQIK